MATRSLCVNSSGSLALALRSIVPVRTFLLLYGGLPADELLVELCSGALAPFRSLDQVLVVAC